MTTTKARISTVQIGTIQLDGIMLPDGTFGILAAQVSKLFPNSIPLKHATNRLKTLLGIKIPFPKTKVIRSDSDTAYHARELNYLTLLQLEKAVTEMAFKGDEDAQNFVRIMTGLSLTQLWSDAFRIKFEVEERTQYVSCRQEHQKHFHTRLTPFWKEDGCTGKDYSDRVVEFKDVSCLPKFKSVDDYTMEELKLLNIQEVKYQTLREVGLSHEDSINKIRI